MTEEMGYPNFKLAMKAIREGRLDFYHEKSKTMKGNDFAQKILMWLAEETLDWPLTDEQERKHHTCRLYRRGYGEIVEAFNMLAVPEEAYKHLPENEWLEAYTKLAESRRKTAESRIRDAFRRMTERGLLTCIQNPVKGRNYGAYMLLLGDDAENNEILDYNRACLLEMYKAHVYEPVTRRAEPEDDTTSQWIEADDNDDSVWGL